MAEPSTAITLVLRPSRLDDGRLTFAVVASGPRAAREPVGGLNDMPADVS